MKGAKAWVQRYARPLEVAKWEFFYEQGSKDKVIRYLSAFQNEDGGFGHALEPDFWLPQSSPMATWTAGQLLVEIGAKANEPIVMNLLSYLLETPQVGPGMWPAVLPENNLYPHAPWWHWAEDAQQGWMFNPSVELSAFLIYWSPVESSGAQLGWESLTHALRHLMQVPNMERHELSNYRHALHLLASSKVLFDEMIEYSFDDVLQKVQELIKGVIDRDVANWGKGYRPLPLDFIQGRDDPLYVELKPIVEQNLNFYLEQRTAEGIWVITWDWGQYAEEFSIAKRYWQGILAVDRYRILQTFEEV